MRVRIHKKLRHENIPCTPQYFEENFRDKSLEVTHKAEQYYRVRDQQNEEWGFFEGQLIPEAKEKESLQKEAIPDQ
ncbi:hypothetical protein GCM10027284_09150 [Cyclobacterium sediminis]